MSGRPLLLLALLAACPDPNLGRVYPDILVTGGPLEFGDLPVLNTRILALSISNRGGAQLAVSAYDLEGPGAAVFQVDLAPDGLASGDASTVEVSFRPEAEALYEAVLVIRSNDPDEPAVQVPLFGEGRTVACIQVDPPAIHFGLVGEGQIAVESLTILAGCTAPLLVEAVGLSDETPPEFGPVGSWGSGVIEVGESLPLSVSFRPRVGQEVLTGSLRITSADPANRVVEVPLTAELNRAPVADCGVADRAGAPGAVLTFDGSASHDPDGHEPLTYDWRVDRRPLDSNTELSGWDSQAPSLELDVAGSWELSLGVTDALGIPSVERCRIKIRSVPAEKLYVELIWDHPLTDLDLHFLAPGGVVGEAGDCWWGNPAPDFGVLGDPSDDPLLDRDDLAGFGPEVMTYADPAPGTYRIVVDFSKANGALDPSTQATVRIFQFGVIVAELTRTLDAQQTLWNVAAVDWPAGDVSPVDRVVAY